MFRKRQREEWRRPIWPDIEKYLWWAGILVVLAWAFFELYTLTHYVNLVWVNNETLRLPGWTGFTIHALIRFSGFILGTIWLGVMVWAEGRLEKALQNDKLRQISRRLLIYAVAVGIVSVILLRLLPWLWGVPI